MSGYLACFYSVYWKGEVWGDAETIDPDCENYSRPKIIAELPEKVVTDKMLYETFADFLTKPAEDQGYVIEPGNKNSGQSLSYGVVGNAIRAVLWIARAAHYEKGTSDTKIFFQCLDSNSSSSQATWLKGLITNVRRLSFKRMVNEGLYPSLAPNPKPNPHGNAHVHPHAHVHPGGVHLLVRVRRAALCYPYDLL